MSLYPQVDNATLAIIKEPTVIAVNQDRLGVQVIVVVLVMVLEAVRVRRSGRC